MLPTSTGERFLAVLFLGVLALIVIAVAFGVSVMILRLRNERRAERWGRLEGLWDEVVLDILSGDRDPEAFWSLVLPRDALFAVNYLQRYHRRLAGAEQVRLRVVARPYLPLVARRAGHRDPDRRAWAVQTVGELGLEDYLPTVRAALDDPSPIVAMVAARCLVRPGRSELLAPVVDRLQRFTTWSPNFLASLLAAVGPEATPLLRAVLADQRREPAVRAVAATALAYLLDVDAADVAAAVLAATTDPELQAAVLRLLERVGGGAHAGAVRPRLAAENPVVRAAAAAALGRIGDHDDLLRLRAACEDESRWVALHAARALRNAGDTETLQRLATSGRERATLAMQVLSEVDR
jgi:hypothetical protein